ncbi:MAG TPA: ATP-binding protein [Nitrospirota bacterium]|nr:ATP-binding protein [Nitrospirota bacterium]
MEWKRSRKFRGFLAIFMTAAVLSASFFLVQSQTYLKNKSRLENELFRQQELATALAAQDFQSYVRDVVVGLDAVGSAGTAGTDVISRAYDSLGDRITCISLFDAGGRMLYTVSSKPSPASLPEDSRYEEFFSVPKLTNVSYISPLTKMKGGGEAVIISCPVKTARGEFRGVAAAMITPLSISRFCKDYQDKGGMSIVFYDQRGRKVCPDDCCKFDLGLKETPEGGDGAEVAQGVDGDRERLLYRPLQLEGYRWYLVSRMSLGPLDGALSGDLARLSVLGGLMLLSLLGGGLYAGRAILGADGHQAEQLKKSDDAAGAAARVEKEKFESVMDSIPDGLVLLDGEGRVLDVNGRAAEILGSLPDAEGQGVKALAARLRDDAEREIGGRAYKVFSLPARNPGIYSRVRVIRDVTQEKALEQKRRDLASMITHDIKSPLTVIIGIAQWLSEKKAASEQSDETRNGIESIARASGRVLNLVDNFLFLSSVEGAQRLVKKPVNLNAFLNKAHLEFYLEAKQRKIRLEYTLAEHSPVVQMDETQMMRAVANIIDNALKYTPEGGEVSVSAKNFRDYVTVSVTDTGPGISKKDMPHIFERYYRSRDGRNAPKGTGLGLSIVKAVVESHGGKVDVASEEGKGSTFTIRLPLSRSSENHAA